MMTHVHIKGPLLSISGYGVHARQICRWAFNHDFHVTTDITPWGKTPWYTDRKNTGMTLALLCDLLKDDPNVGIILKTNCGGNSSVDRHITQAKLKNILKQVRKGPFPKVYLLHGYLNEKEVSSLYKHPKVKGLISLTHGEGFGLPLLEAAACGLPVCATNWSAHTEFLNLGDWTKVSGRIEPIPQNKPDSNIWMPGSHWANIDIPSAKKTLEEFIFDDKPSTEKLQKEIQNRYSFDKISIAYDLFFTRWK